jgi:ketosteroid isomerase-like protein
MALHAVRASAIHAGCMDTLTEDARRQIEQIHSSWIEFEIAGASHNLMTLCADDIEFCPPDAQPVCGRAEVAAHLARGTNRIHSVEVGGCRIRGSNEIAYLTANYKTTLCATEQSAPKQVLGSHLWILLMRNGKWLVSLISWSVWG